MIKLCAFADESAGDIMGQIAALKRNNMDLIELRNFDGKGVLDLTEEEAVQYYELLKENGISVWSIGSPIGKVDISIDIDEYLKKVDHICKIAKIFHTKYIRMFSFFKAYDQKEKVIKYLQKMVEVADKHGVYMCHENEKEIYGDTVDRVLDILDNVKGIKSVYDPANYLQCDQKAEYSLKLLHHRADYFHIKDVIAETGELVPAGYGDGDIATLIDWIKDDKVLTLEPHLAIFPGYSAIDNTEMKNKFHFTSNIEAFDAAVSALKKLLTQAGYKEVGTAFVKE